MGLRIGHRPLTKTHGASFFYETWQIVILTVKALLPTCWTSSEPTHGQQKITDYWNIYFVCNPSQSEKHSLSVAIQPLHTANVSFKMIEALKNYNNYTVIPGTSTINGYCRHYRTRVGLHLTSVFLGQCKNHCEIYSTGSQVTRWSKNRRKQIYLMIIVTAIVTYTFKSIPLVKKHGNEPGKTIGCLINFYLKVHFIIPFVSFWRSTNRS